MAKQTKKKAPKGPAKKAKPAPKPVAEKSGAANGTDLDTLRKPVEAAKTALDAAEAEAQVLAEKADAKVAGARHTYLTALAPFRMACRKAGRECPFPGGRGTNVAERVAFLVERVEKGVRVMVRGRADTEEVIPLSALKASLGKCAYGYTDKHLGPREKVGNKGGGLRNRLAAALAEGR